MQSQIHKPGKLKVLQIKKRFAKNAAVSLTLFIAITIWSETEGPPGVDDSRRRGI
jgi:hypothetical protein